MRRSFLPLVLAMCGCGGAPAGGDASADGPGTETPADTTGGGDSNPDVSASCNPAAVSFPQGGTLVPGALCDELYACADDAAGAARIETASPRFSCAPGAEPGSGCDAYTCAFRDPGGPSTLDASEIADICAITVLAPPPALRCTVFVNAR
jgi:hypothetical protein